MMYKNGWCGDIKYIESNTSEIKKDVKPRCPCSCACPSCGKDLGGSSKYCTECGFKLGK